MPGELPSVLLKEGRRARYYGCRCRFACWRLKIRQFDLADGRGSSSSLSSLL